MNKVIEKIENAEIVVSATFVSVSCLMIFTSALFRTFGKPINWAQDFSLLIFSWSVFLGADVALRRNKLVRVELFTARLPEKALKILAIVIYVIIAAFLIYSVYYGVILCKKSIKRTFPGISWLSYVWVTASYPCGAFLMLITTVLKIKQQIVDLVKGGKR